MPYPDVFRILREAFDKAEVPFVLVGALAVNHYRFSRRTLDIDFFSTEEGYEKARPLLEDQGYQEFRRTHLFVRLREKKELPGSIDVALLFTDKETLDGIVREGKETKILGNRFLVPSLNHLIALKLHAVKYDKGQRDYRDLRDIIEMVKINHVEVTTSDFRNLCLRYGTREIYEKIAEAVKAWRS